MGTTFGPPKPVFILVAKDGTSVACRFVIMSLPAAGTRKKAFKSVGLGSATSRVKGLMFLVRETIACRRDATAGGRTTSNVEGV